jgi:diguanylate cyclase (GGDEF)-like protein
VDGLTNIMNRRIFDIEFGREFSNAKRYGEDLSLISLDLDHFKKINDQYGHFFGDLALKSFTREVSQFLRTGDIFCRWGGDEFSIVLPRTDRENALKVAEKLRTVVKNISVRTDDSEIHFTVSLGVAGILPEDKDVSEMIERADRALYEAKKAGRDRTVLDKGAF